MAEIQKANVSHVNAELIITDLDVAPSNVS